MSISKKTFGTILIILSVVCFALNCSAEMLLDTPGDTDAGRPEQPTSGPGGTAYIYDEVDVYHFGIGGNEYWIYEPVTENDKKLPVVVFLHGWGAMFPQVYGGWIRHLAMSGNIVIYARYQESFMAMPDDMYKNAIDAVKNAFEFLSKNNNVVPDLTRVSAVGHSFGGVMAANFAADWSSRGLPEIKAFMSVQPGDGENLKKRKFIPVKTSSIMSDYSLIPASTKFVAISGADDNLVADVAAKKIYLNAVKVPQKNKNFIVVESDTHGNPPLLADHMQPMCTDDDLDADYTAFDGGEKGRMYKPGESPHSKRSPRLVSERNGFESDAYDYYPLWRTFDALTSCTFNMTDCELALGTSPALKNMGTWSDGTPVKELVVSEPKQ